MNEEQATEIILAFLRELQKGNFDLVRNGGGGYLFALIGDLEIGEAAAMEVLTNALSNMDAAQRSIVGASDP
jgi:hypothetical protein